MELNDNSNSRALYMAVFRPKVYYSRSTGVVIEYSFTCGRCKISSINGTATITDWSDYTYGTWRMDSYPAGGPRAHKYLNTGRVIYPGTKVFVNYYLRANLLNGDLLNGNNFNDSVTVIIP